MSYAAIGAMAYESASRIHMSAKLKRGQACCVALGAEGYGGSATKVAHRAPTVDTCYRHRGVSAWFGRGPEGRVGSGRHTMVHFTPFPRAHLVACSRSLGLRALPDVHCIAVGGITSFGTPSGGPVA